MTRTGDQESLGGKGVVLLYRLDSAHVLKQVDGTTNATTLAHATLDMGLVQTSAPAFQDDGSLVVSLPHLSNSAKFWTFRELACPPTSGTTTSIEAVLEDGEVVKRSVSSGTAKPEFLAVIYPSDLTADGQQCIVFPCTVTNTSGSFTTARDNYSQLSLELRSIPAKAAINLLPAMHIAAITAHATNVVVAEDSQFKVEFVDGPA